jgi:hypothetical protein
VVVVPSDNERYQLLIIRTKVFPYHLFIEDESINFEIDTLVLILTQLSFVFVTLCFTVAEPCHQNDQLKQPDGYRRHGETNLNNLNRTPNTTIRTCILHQVEYIILDQRWLKTSLTT